MLQFSLTSIISMNFPGSFVDLTQEMKKGRGDISNQIDFILISCLLMYRGKFFEIIIITFETQLVVVAEHLIAAATTSSRKNRGFSR